MSGFNFEKNIDLEYTRELPEYNSSKTAEIYTHVLKGY